MHPLLHSPSRRTLLRAAGAGAGAAALAAAAGCGSSTAASGRTRIRFLMNKPEVVDHFTDLVARYNAEQDDVLVVLDTAPTSVLAQFVRGAPPDIACYNFRIEAANLVRAGVLADLSDLPEAAGIDPAYQDLVTQFASYQGQTSALPYSIGTAGMIYNVDLFEQHGVAVPTTWSELLAACETFTAAGVAPFMNTYREVWTLAQGMFDYTTGSGVDVAAFHEGLQALGADAGPDAEVSFTRTLGPAVERMVQLSQLDNPDAPSLTYYDGNLRFGRGEAAMYFQGPWALGEIVKVDPDIRLGSFPLPVTDDPAQARARVNLDLALWIPRETERQEAARAFASWLLRPDVVDTYNADNSAQSPRTGAPPLADERLAGLQPCLDEKRIYQGISTYVPDSIPVGNYVQDAVLSGDPERLLSRLDTDWQRRARRAAA
ncbi:ABC transporter substrate-binding protein [Kineococcus sp. SYSU DK006]|uniref:ABC transporter substrate-binding protein n=1 Tax=Kineococcus sp. SYSU DK006 TaxID=3383127 RepID=UPI003D7D32BE